MKKFDVNLAAFLMTLLFWGIANVINEPFPLYAVITMYFVIYYGILNYAKPNQSKTLTHVRSNAFY